MTALDACSCSAPLQSTGLHFVCRMNGSAQSMLVMQEDELWVLKPKSTLQGSNVLGNELLGSKLCESLGLPIPAYKVVHLDEKFCNDSRVWLYSSQGDMPVKPGLHFASRYMPDLLGKDLFEMIPSTLKYAVRNVSACLGMFVFDVWAMHGDSRQAVFEINEDGIYPTFIDHSHLFGGPSGSVGKPFIDGKLLQKLALQSYQRNLLHETWISKMESVIPSALESAIPDLPVGWFCGDLVRLRYTLLRRLQNLRPLLATTFAVLELRLEQMGKKEESNRKESHDQRSVNGSLLQHPLRTLSGLAAHIAPR